MYQKKRVGMSFFCRFCLCGCNARVYRTSALKKFYVFLRYHRGDVCAQIAIGNEYNIVVVNILHYFYCGRRCYAYIAHGFKRRCGVDVSDYCVIGIVFFYRVYKFHVHLLCHRATCDGIGKEHFFVRRKYFYRFRHKSYSAHKYVFLLYLFCEYAELI